MGKDVVKDKTVANITSIAQTAAVDIGGNVTYSLVIGGALDYLSGLNLTGIIASRMSATGMNAITGGPYGWWRERVYRSTKTTKNSCKVRKTFADLLAFNIFQIPIYGVAIVIGSLISEGRVNWEKVRYGTTYLATISPLIGPTMGYYMDIFRKLFGVKSAAEGSYITSKMNKD